MSYLRLLFVFLCCVIVSSNAWCATKLNVLFVCMDDLNHSLGCFGNEQVHTPNIDDLAKRGVRFTRAYAQWPSCLPSRFSFLSGWAPPKTEVIDFSYTSRQGPLAKAVYLPEHFKNHGYTTARLDKIFHIGRDDAASWTISEEPHRDRQGRFKAIWTGIEAQTLGLDDRIVAQGNYDVRIETGVYQILSDETRDDELFDGRTAARAVELLERFSESGEPFFLAVGFRRPHLPWLAPQRYFDLYPYNTVSLPPRAPEAVAKVDEQVHREMIAHYYAATTFADAQFGKVLAALKQFGLAESTIVVLMGDHGYCLGEREGYFAKGNLWERSLLTPLVLALPDRQNAGSVQQSPVELLDVYPTLVELCGLPEPHVELQGQSLEPMVIGDDYRVRNHAVSYDYNRDLNGLDRTIRTRRFRYTERADGHPLELIDYQHDPYEWTNLVASREHRVVLERLRTQLQARIQKVQVHD